MGLIAYFYMKIVAISDVHCKYRYIQNIPEGDIIICAGDISYCGEMDVIKDFADWFGKLPFTHKITIVGNHEVGVANEDKRKIVRRHFENNGIIFLHNSSVIIDGIHFYGSPATPFFHNWEFNFNRGKDIAAEWAKIPNGTNVLITHGPPYGILDSTINRYSAFGEIEEVQHVGCEDLLARIKQLPHLKTHIFGHVHLNGQVEKYGIKFANASICDENYYPTNPPQIIEI